jgi:hypothetical protein
MKKMSLKEFMAGRPPLQKGSAQVFLGLTMLVGGIVLLMVTHQNYWWAAFFLGVAVASKGGIEVSRIPGE